MPSTRKSSGLAANRYTHDIIRMSSPSRIRFLCTCSMTFNPFYSLNFFQPKPNTIFFSHAHRQCESRCAQTRLEENSGKKRVSYMCIGSLSLCAGIGLHSKNRISDSTPPLKENWGNGAETLTLVSAISECKRWWARDAQNILLPFSVSPTQRRC
jgi:hypothetical protein